MEKIHPSGRLIHIAEIRKAFVFMTWFIITFKYSQLSLSGSSVTLSFGQVCHYLNWSVTRYWNMLNTLDTFLLKEDLDPKIHWFTVNIVCCDTSSLYDKCAVVSTHKDHVGNHRCVGLSDSEIPASEVVTSFEIRGGQLLNMTSGVQSTVHLFLHAPWLLRTQDDLHGGIEGTDIV